MSGYAALRRDASRPAREAVPAALGLALACALAVAAIEPGPASPGTLRGGDDAHPEEEVLDEYRDRLLEERL